MFEKESKEYAIGLTYPKFQDSQIANIVLRDVEGAFQKGAECGYNKANEWHFVKDKLPPSGETVLLYFGTDFMGKVVICTGRVDCKGNWYKNVYGEPIKWQEIVLPKENE